MVMESRPRSWAFDGVGETSTRFGRLQLIVREVESEENPIAGRTIRPSAGR
jgi:hypothetical protein